MLARKNSLAAAVGGIGGEPSFVAAGAAGVTDYGPDETLSEGNDIIWASRYASMSGDLGRRNLICLFVKVMRNTGETVYRINSNLGKDLG